MFDNAEILLGEHETVSLTGPVSLTAMEIFPTKERRNDDNLRKYKEMEKGDKIGEMMRENKILQSRNYRRQDLLSRRLLFSFRVKLMHEHRLCKSTSVTSPTRRLESHVENNLLSNISLRRIRRSGKQVGVHLASLVYIITVVLKLYM